MQNEIVYLDMRKRLAARTVRVQGRCQPGRCQTVTRVPSPRSPPSPSASECGRQEGLTDTSEFTGTRLEALAFGWSENAKRRHSTPSQTAVAEIRREKLFPEYAGVVEEMKAEAKAKQATGKSADGKAGGRGRATNLARKVGQGNERHERSTDAQRARAADTNRRYLGSKAGIL